MSVQLDLAHALRGHSSATRRALLDEVDDPLRSRAVGPVVGEEEGIWGSDDGLVRSDDPALGRIEDGRQRLECQGALPLVRRIPAGHRPLSVVALANRDSAGCLVADIPGGVGVEQVLSGHRELRRGRAELLPRARGVEQVEGIEGRGGLERRPAQGHPVGAASRGRIRVGGRSRGRHGCIRAHRLVCVDACDVRHDRAVDRLANSDRNRLASGDLDDLVAGRECDGSAINEIGVAVELLEHEVGDIGAEVRETPRDRVVVADEDARQTRHCPAGDIVVAVGGLLRAVQPRLVPDARHHRREVRVVREQGLARLGLVAGKGP